MGEFGESLIFGGTFRNGVIGVATRRENSLLEKQEKRNKAAFKADTMSKFMQKNGKYSADYSKDPNYSG